MRNVATSWLALVMMGSLLATAGCGSKAGSGGDAPTASINGSKPDEGIEGKAGSETGAPAANAQKADPMNPVAIIETSMGSIVVTLDGERAPLTVAHFLRYVATGQYDRTIFHQVFKDRAILGGAYSPELVEKPALRTVRNEANNGLKNVRGTIGLVRCPDVIDSAKSQFYINLSDNANLDHKGNSAEEYGYCVFGQVAPESMAVVEKIAAVEVHDITKDQQPFEQAPVQTVMINSVRQAK